MAVSKVLSGELVQLVPVEDEHAQFTRQIRSDPELTQFIPALHNTLQEQRAWIARQREKDGDYFYIIADKAGQPLGTVAVYDIDAENDRCEFGRYISRGNALQNVEAAILLLDYIFAEHAGCVDFMNDQRNKKINSFWKRFGALYQADRPMDGWTAAHHSLTREDYQARRESLIKLVQKGVTA